MVLFVESLEKWWHSKILNIVLQYLFATNCMMPAHLCWICPSWMPRPYFCICHELEQFNLIKWKGTVPFRDKIEICTLGLLQTSVFSCPFQFFSAQFQLTNDLTPPPPTRYHERERCCLPLLSRSEFRPLYRLDFLPVIYSVSYCRYYLFMLKAFNNKPILRVLLLYCFNRDFLQETKTSVIWWSQQIDDVINNWHQVGWLMTSEATQCWNKLGYI